MGCASWLQRRTVPLTTTRRMPPAHYFESLMHYSGTRFCTWLFHVGPLFAAASPPIYSLCFLVPIIRSVVHRPGFINLTLFLCALSSSSFLLFYFSGHLFDPCICANSLERVTHIPLDTIRSVRLTSTNNDATSTSTVQTYNIVDSQEDSRPPSVAQSLLRSISIFPYICQSNKTKTA